MEDVPERRRIVSELTRGCSGFTDIIIGVASATVPYAAWLSHECELPMAYIRPELKEHGRNKRVDGADIDEKDVTLLYDSTVHSLEDLTRMLTEEGASTIRVMDVDAIRRGKGVLGAGGNTSAENPT